MKIHFSLLLVFTLATQTFADVETSLTWQQAIELLKKNNSDYQSAELALKATQSLEMGAQSGYLPSLTGALGYSQSKSMTQDDLTSLYSASVTLSQNLFAGLKDQYKSSQAQANTRVAMATFQIAKSKITYDFTTAVQGLLTAQENVKLSENIVQRRRENLRLVELRFESGRENKGSVLLSEANLAQANYEKLQSQHSLETAQFSVAHLIGTPKSSIKIVDPVPTKNLEIQPNFEDLVLRTPAHQQILATVDSDIASVGVARSAFFPSLNLTAAISKSSPDFFPQNDRWTVGANISIPLFDGGKDKSNLNSATYLSSSSLAKKISVDQQQVETLQKAHQKLLQTIEKLKVDESFQKAALVRAEIARSQYNNGLVSFTEWDNIENELITRQKNLIQSRKDRILSEADWNQVRGEEVFQ